MSKFSKLSIVAIVIAIAVGFAFSFSPAQAAGHETFDLFLSHNINGLPLGFDRSLPVDVYVNRDGSLLTMFTFELGDKVKTSFPAGTYLIEIRLAGAEASSSPLLSLGSVIPAGVDVSIFAQMGAPLNPTLRVRIK